MSWVKCTETEQNWGDPDFKKINMLFKSHFASFRDTNTYYALTKIIN